MATCRMYDNHALLCHCRCRRRWRLPPSSNAAHASLEDTPLRHPRRPPPPLPSPSLSEVGARGGRRTVTRRTDDDPGVAFVTVPPAAGRGGCGNARCLYLSRDLVELAMSNVDRLLSLSSLLLPSREEDAVDDLVDRALGDGPSYQLVTLSSLFLVAKVAGPSSLLGGHSIREGDGKALDCRQRQRRRRGCGNGRGNRGGATRRRRVYGEGTTASSSSGEWEEEEEERRYRRPRG